MEWTKEERIAGSRKLNIRQFGKDNDPVEQHEIWARKQKGSPSNLVTMIDLQCEVTALREALGSVLEQVDVSGYRTTWSEYNDAMNGAKKLLARIK